MKRNIGFVCQVVKWRDQVNGNTYHSVRITRCKDGKTIVGVHAPYTYGYGNQYQDTALDAMAHNKWLPTKYRGKNEKGIPDAFRFERENGYPILWIVNYGLKREMISNGTL